ncbi:MAG TPA: hypothetical protein VEA41_03445 [Salinarimonas sp.]|nr:hypothetical protein [Salinarimonas sp.]
MQRPGPLTLLTARAAAAVSAGALAWAGAVGYGTWVAPRFEAAALVEIAARDAGARPTEAVLRHALESATSAAVLARAQAATSEPPAGLLRDMSVAPEGTRLRIGVRRSAAPEAAALANALAGGLVETFAPSASVAADPAALESLRRERDGAEERLASARARPDVAEPASRVLEAAGARSREAAAKVEGLEREAAQAADLVAIPRPGDEPALEAARLRLREAIRLHEEALLSLGPRHPALLEAEQRRRAAERTARTELRRVLGTAREDLERARAAEKRAEDSMKRIGPRPGADPAIARLEAELERRREAYDRAAAARSAGGASPFIARLAAPATVPERALPVPLALALSAAGAGGVLGWLAAAMGMRPRRPAPVPVAEAPAVRRGGVAPPKPDEAGVLPHLPEHVAAALAATRRPDSAYGREVAALAEAVLPAVGAGAPLAIAVTSAEPASGAATLAANLAAALAGRGLRVLLIDPTADAALHARVLGRDLGAPVPDAAFAPVAAGTGAAYQLLPLARLVRHADGATQPAVAAMVQRLVRPHFDVVLTAGAALARSGAGRALLGACDVAVVTRRDAGGVAFATYRLVPPAALLDEAGARAA